ncbi:Peptidase T [Pantoea agglomerans]|uniref:Peptidase T n=1 Tax=Enterobacter agglomerans TaxID=549 RepID=A0A379AIC6_ENTAG|nr:Peptidase T [Pantoea agglomerans]
MDRRCRGKGCLARNIFTGGYNYHGKHEFASLNIMAKSVEVIVRLSELAAQKEELNPQAQKRLSATAAREPDSVSAQIIRRRSTSIRH